MRKKKLGEKKEKILVLKKINATNFCLLSEVVRMSKMVGSRSSWLVCSGCHLTWKLLTG